MVEVGDSVQFWDPYGNQHNALVTTVFSSGHQGDGTEYPAINLVIVSTDNAKTDQYGRQIERHTSVVEHRYQSAHGMYYIKYDDI